MTKMRTQGRSPGLFLHVVLLAVAVSLVSAGDSPAAEDSIQAFADYAVFSGDSTANFVEIYLQVLLEGAELEESPSGWVEAEFSFSVYLNRRNEDRVLFKQWTRSAHFDSRSDAERPGLSLFDLLDIALAPGQYQMEIEIGDLNGKGEAQLTFAMDVRSFRDDELVLSDIQLARSAERVQEGTGFWIKNGYRIIPNPSTKYGKALSVLNSYTEVYGLSPPDSSGDDRFTAVYEVEDMEGKTVLTKGPFLMKKAGTTAVLVGQIDVDELQPGYYRLVLAVADTVAVAGSGGSQSTKLFIRVGEGDMVEPFGLTPAESTAAELELKYMASPAEIRRFRELNPVGQATFLTRLWAEKDPDPTTPENEARSSLHERLIFAQQNLYEMNRVGIDTDRGRVYVKYGPPSDVTTMSGDLSCKDHEIWIYYQEREWRFVFFDEFGSGEYRLIHSTYPGEVERLNWESIVCEPQRAD